MMIRNSHVDAFGPNTEGRLDVKFPKRRCTYYSVTEAEIEVYAQFGWLSSMFLTLFGASLGFSLGCVVALVQGNIPADAQTTLWWLAGSIGLVSVVFLVITITLVVLQRKNRKTWKVE
jgi:hypothetical protein